MKLRMTSLKLTTLLSDLSDEDAHVVAQYLGGSAVVANSLIANNYDGAGLAPPNPVWVEDASLTLLFSTLAEDARPAYFSAFSQGQVHGNVLYDLSGLGTPSGYTM